MRTRIVIAVVLAAGALAMPHAGAASIQVPVAGKWYNAGPCTPTSVVPDPGHPAYADITCVGSSVWTGTWQGITDFTVTARYNLVTSAGDGTLVEIFVGRAGNRRGTMTFHETVHVDGNTHALRIVAELVSGTGGFANSHAHVVFTGRITSATNGFGTYNGTWTPG
ncbi:MAG: hypothetical protein QOG53_513 [Frankiales bacterium]|jgi:hypothetical protein|nr:hypothetical protein [Frankiales bacterium]